MQFSVVLCCGSPKSVQTTQRLRGHDLLIQLCSVYPESDVSEFYILCNGRKVDNDSLLADGKIYHVIPRLVGGKGGFGSMLRAIGAQIEKTTSREACRDLSGRRMRDINNEKKLKEWLAKEAEREKEKEERKQERLSRHLNPGQHKFDDPQYHEQRSKVQEDLQDALHTGLKRAHKKGEASSSGPSKKMKSSKSSKEWLGMDIDSDDLDSDSDAEAHPGSSCLDKGVSTPVASASGDIAVKQEVEELPSGAAGSHSGSANASRSDDSSSSLSQQKKQSGEDQTRDEAVTSSSSASDVKSESENSLPSSVNVKTEPDCENPSHSLLSQLPPPVSGNSTDIKPDQTDTPVAVDSNTPIDLDLYSSAADLASLGLERLKCALIARSLKCGGTLEERAARLFSVRGLSPDQIDPALIAKSKGKGKKSK